MASAALPAQKVLTAAMRRIGPWGRSRSRSTGTGFRIPRVKRTPARMLGATTAVAVSIHTRNLATRMRKDRCAHYASLPSSTTATGSASPVKEALVRSLLRP